MIQVVQFLLSMSFLVFFHELGHFLFAKLFKTRVSKFYLFFNPWFSLFKFQKGDTEYGIGWVPLGGYVKIDGMLNESVDEEGLPREAQPWEFRSKPAWQRLLMVSGGILMNFIMAFVIYFFISFVWGEQILSVEKINHHGIVADSVGKSFGFMTGDKIVTVNGKKENDFQVVYNEFLLNEPHEMVVERNGEEVLVSLEDEQLADVIQHQSLIFDYRRKFEILDFADTSSARKGGLQKLDIVIGINGKPMMFYDEIAPEIQKHKGEVVQLSVLRNRTDTLELDVEVSQAGFLGVYINLSVEEFIESKENNFTEALSSGISRTFQQTTLYFQQLKLFAKPKVKAYRGLGSFITIGKLFSSSWHWRAFWSMTAFLSIVIAIMNLLPIPALDGGHIVFSLFEIITGRKPSERFLAAAQMVGVIILLLLMSFAISNDLIKYVF